MSETNWRDDGRDTQHKYAVTKWELHYEIHGEKVDLVEDYEDEIEFGTPEGLRKTIVMISKDMTLEEDLTKQLLSDLDALISEGYA